jgi:hypothetical protein
VSPSRGDSEVNKEQIEAKLREIRGALQSQAGAAASKPPVLAVAGAGGLALVAISYLLGKRRGRLRSTVVEIRRV